MAFTLSVARRPGEQITTLLHEALPVARITFRSPSPVGEGSLTIERLALSKPAPDLDIAILERLYVLSLRQETESKYCFAEAGRKCEPTLSQGELLRKLVAARARAKPGVPWQVVTMTARKVKGGTPDDVSARVTLEGRPLEGTPLYFNRAPHSTCTAKADAQGVATCKLVDQHGHDDGDHDDAAVVVTYPGDVRADFARVPMTLVIPR